MNCCLKNGSHFSEITSNSKIPKRVSGFCSAIGVSQFKASNSMACRALSSGFMGQGLKPLTFVSDQKGSINWRLRSPNHFSVNAQASICVSRAMRWWEKTLQPNMIEIHSAKELVDLLVNAGDRLVIIDFYSPGCGGCKTLHPKICQLAEQNPNAMFLKVNYEELKTMCYGLKIHVLPFFRFYRGSEGRLCSFSCTNATIKKFKEAMAKHGTDRCSLGPAKGLDEIEVLELASLGEIQLSSALTFPNEETMGDLVVQGMALSGLSQETIVLNALAN